MPEPLKILISTPWFYPAFRAGGPVQSILNLVNQYNQNVEYYVFTANTDLNQVKLDVTPDTWIQHNTYTRVYYTESDKRSEKLVGISEKIKPDVLFIIGIYSWHFNVVPLYFGKAKKKILSVRGMMHAGALTQKSAKKKLFFFLWKIFGLQHKAVFHATDTYEAREIEQLFSEDIKIEVAGNFPTVIPVAPLPEKKRNELTLVSVALISPMKNHLLVLETLQKCEANITYHIYGPVKDAAYWNACKDVIVQMPANITVRYHGEIDPGQVPKALEEGHVFILPSKSENFGHSFIEALSSGRPVITSDFTPWNGLKGSFAGLNTALNATSLLHAIQFFAEMDIHELQKWSDAAAGYARAAINTNELKEQYDNLFGRDKHSTVNNGNEKVG